MRDVRLQVRNFLVRTIDRLFFADRFGYLEDFSKIPTDMLEFNNLHEMLNFLAVRLAEAARLEGVQILLYDPRRQTYLETLFDEAEASASGRSSQLTEGSRILRMLRKEQRLWTSEDLKHFGTDESYAALEELQGMNGVAFFPVSKRNGILGVVILGLKRSREKINPQERKLFEAVQLRLENFLSQAMVVTQDALNMVKDSHDMKNDVTALKGRSTWRAMHMASWRMELDRLLVSSDLAKVPEHLKQLLKSIRAQADEWFGEMERSRLIEDQAIKRLSHRLRNWAEAGRAVSEGLRGSHPVEAIELGQAAKLSVERWRPHAEKKNLSLVLATGGDLFVRGERGLVEQVIENLIDNAIKATDVGQVEVSCRPESAGVLLEVRDSGCGIPEGELVKIFEKPYYQGHLSKGPDQSTGVGLYLVAQYVRSLGGKVWAESRVGRGSSFFVELPRYNQDRQNTVA